MTLKQLQQIQEDQKAVAGLSDLEMITLLLSFPKEKARLNAVLRVPVYTVAEKYLRLGTMSPKQRECVQFVLLQFEPALKLLRDLKGASILESLSTAPKVDRSEVLQLRAI